MDGLKFLAIVTFVLILGLFVSQGQSETSICGIDDSAYEYNATLGGCYKFNFQPANWSEAFELCDQQGSKLAIINSQDEADYLTDLITRSSDTINWEEGVEGLNLVGAVYLGFYAEQVYGPYFTIEGQTLAEAGYDIWPEGQPDNNRGPELCGSMFTTGQLNDMGCFWKAFSICEKRV